MSQVWAFSCPTSVCKIVLLALADNANDEGICWPSIPTIAGKCDLSDRGVRLQIRKLEEMGVVSVDRGGGCQSNTYKIHPLNAVHPAPYSAKTCTVFRPPLHRIQPNHQGTVKEPVPPYPQELRGLDGLGGENSAGEVPTTTREPDPDPHPRSHGKSKAWNPTPEQLRLNKLFNRRPTTPWTPKELKAWKLVAPDIDEQDLAVLERYYGYQLPEGKDYRRRDLQTLLNNFFPEVDRARKYREPKPW